MKKKTLRLGVLVLSFLFIISCSSDDDTPSNSGSEGIANADQEIDLYVWRGMNAFYLYKSEVSDLANDRFNSDQDLFRFLSNFSNPEQTFNELRTKRTVTVNNESFRIDPFSFIVEDYVALEQSFNRVSKSNGMDFRVSLVSETSDDVFGYVRYVKPGTDAAAKGIKRGDYFNAVDGVKLTRSSDFNTIFGKDSYTISLAKFENENIVPIGTNISLSKSEFTDNPIQIAKTLDYNGEKIGYMMYTSFLGDFDQQINDVFGQFKTDGITNLVLDLRYNRGGFVSTAINLASMITGQFTGEVLTKTIWNEEIQPQIEANDPESLVTRFTDKLANGVQINSLNLTNIYILTTEESASASELIINGLKPYINVVQIGETTSGKYQGSFTIYDSDNFGREGANPNHTYAIQPLVIKSANKDNVTDYVAGLFPDIPVIESVLNLGTLGEDNEPLLKAALDRITGTPVAAVAKNKTDTFNRILDWNIEATSPTYNRMYIDKIPDNLNFE